MRANFIQKYPGITSVPQPDGSGNDSVSAPTDVQFLKWLSRVSTWTATLEVNLGSDLEYIGDIDDGEFLQNGIVERGTYLDERYKAVPQSTLLIDVFGLDLANTITLIFGESCKVRTLISGYELKFGVLIQMPELGGVEMSRNPDGFGYGPSAVVGTFDGVVFPLYDNTSGALTGTFDVSPKLYWPYARSDGSLPIWNHFTGAQLIASNTPEFNNFTS